MKIKEEYYNIKALSEFGFIWRESEEVDFFGRPREVDYSLAERFNYHLGFSRRGQSYYITIHPETRELYVYANEPDGSGAAIAIGNVLLEMFEYGVIEA